MGKMPEDIRCCVRVKLDRSVPKECKEWYITSANRGIGLTVKGKDIVIDFKMYASWFEDEDRTVLVTEYKEADENFKDGFNALTLDVLQYKTVEFRGPLDNTVDVNSPGAENKFTCAAHIMDMVLTSPYDEFDDVILVEKGVVNRCSE